MMPSLSDTKVYLAIGATDMRKSINGLSLLVVDYFDRDPLSGNLFAFCNRKQDIVKVLYWEMSGFCLWMKRLEKHKFRWPQSEEEMLGISRRELNWLLDGLSIEQQDAHQRLNYTEVF